MTIKQININNNLDQSDPIFETKLYPHRSLGWFGFLFLMGLYFISVAVFGVLFIVQGAWPISVFMVASVFAIWFAFRRNYLDAHNFEIIRLYKDQLIVEDHHKKRGIKKWSFNPAWVQLTISEDNIGRKSVFLSSSGKQIEIAEFLGHEQKSDFAMTIKRYLNDLR